MGAEPINVKAFYSYEDYLKLEEQEGVRYEYHNGEVFAMAGGSMNHSSIAYNINRSLNDGLQESDCRSFQADVKVELAKEVSYVYPDVVLTCNREDLENGYVVRSPLLVAEVLSPSTETYDRGTKSILYRRIPSLRYYLLVSQTEPLVQLYSRTASTALFQVQDFSSMEEVIHFPELHCTLSLEQIYHRIRLEPQPANIPGIFSE